MSFFRALCLGAEAEGFKAGTVLKSTAFVVHLYSGRRQATITQCDRTASMYLPYWFNDRSSSSSEAGYILESLKGMGCGLIPDKAKARATRNATHANYMEKLREVLQATGSAKVAAMIKFMGEDSARVLHLFVQANTAPKLPDKSIVVWTYDNKYIHEDKQIAAYVNGLKESDLSPRQCVLTGKMTGNRLVKQPKLRGHIRMAPIKPEFTAYQHWGCIGEENAPMDYDTGVLCSNYIKRLVAVDAPHPTRPEILPNRRVGIGKNNYICFWSTKQVDPLLNTVLALHTGVQEYADDTEEDVDDDLRMEAVGETYKAPWRGSTRHIGKLPSGPFFVAGLSFENQGRMALTTWHESTIDVVRKNIDQYFDDLTTKVVVSNWRVDAERTYSVAAILRATLPPDVGMSWRDSVPQAVFRQMNDAALRGTAFPHSVFMGALNRARLDPKCATIFVRAAYMRAYLNRQARLAGHKEPIAMSLDTSNTDVGYLLGRYVAWMKTLQERAYKNQNADFYSRYNKGMATTPLRVIGRVNELMGAYIAKVRKDHGDNEAKRYLNNISEIGNHLTDIPPRLSVEQQAQYFLGFAQQWAAIVASWERYRQNNETKKTKRSKV